MSESGEVRRNSSFDGDPLKTEEKNTVLGGKKTVTTGRHPAYSEDEVESIRNSFHNVRSDRVDLFVYGTLMSDAHVKLLLNHSVESEEAVLHNYMRVVPPGAFYFTVKQFGAVTNGRLLKDLSPEDIEKIDAFEDEGNLYFRKVVVCRVGDKRRRCMTYVGNISALQKAFGKDILFEDRYSLYLEKKIDQLLETIEPDRQEITRRGFRELLGSAVDTLIDSQFDGNYICNYIMVQAFKDAKPPVLDEVFAIEGLRPYGDHYMKFACKHIVFNQLVDKIRHDFPNAVRLSQKYFRHGLAILLAFLYYNRHAEKIENLLREKALDTVVPGRLYIDYAVLCVALADEVYCKRDMQEICEEVASSWYSTPTPLGAELEFSYLGVRAVNSEPGEDPYFDSFYYFNDFDLQRRTWRMGGHVDAHRDIYAGSDRSRGFFEYAFGRFNIVGDLSRPLFDCPWGMSKLINEAVKFLDIPPHSLHISMELASRESQITAEPHNEDFLACLLMLGGDVSKDDEGILREKRIFNKELDTNMRDSLNFSSRKYHYSKEDQTLEDASEVMEYKFLRLHKKETDYTGIIMALKGYQFATHARPLSIPPQNGAELPEQLFMRKWAASPAAVPERVIGNFIETVEKGLCEESRISKLDQRRQGFLDDMYKKLLKINSFVAENSK